MKNKGGGLFIVVVMLVNLIGAGAAPMPTDARPMSAAAMSAPTQGFAALGALPSWFIGTAPKSAAADGMLPTRAAAATQRAAAGIQSPAPVKQRLTQPTSTADGRDQSPRTSLALPAWFAVEKQRPASDAHHTILQDAVTVSGPAEVNNCDVVTFTVVAVNDAVTTTNVIITNAMPAGFSPPQYVFDVGTVAPNEIITRHAVFAATCGAVSGQNQTIVSQDGLGDFALYEEFLVNPGAITVRKEPSVVEAQVGDVVNWTVYVENTGYGTISNVVVTDTLGAGLQYEGGLTSASFISIPVGETRTFTVAARLISCQDLYNHVVATWDCGGAPCQTENASASIDLKTEEPLLEFNPSPLGVDFCAGEGTFTMPVSNVGNGTAYTPSIAVDFSPLNVSASSAPYSGGAFHLPGPMLPGASYPLTFTLSLPDPPCGMGGQGDTAWYYPTYYDSCGNPFSIPLRDGSWTVSGGTPSLSASKDGPREVYADDLLTYTLDVDFSNLTGDVLITDTFYAPCGYVLVNDGGGTVVTSTYRTTVTWSTSASPWNSTLVFSPTGQCPDICACCGDVVQNTLTASGVDCRDCTVDASDSVDTPVQCQHILSSRGRTAVPPVAEACTTRTFTNTYVFGNTFVNTPTWQGMVFTDALSNLDYVAGSTHISLTDGVQACTATFTIGDTDPLVVGDISPSCPITVSGATMHIVYEAEVEDGFTCAGGEFYDWAYLDVGANGNFWCSACDDGVFEEGVYVGVDEPQVGVQVSGVPSILADCQIYTPTINVERLSAVPAYDVYVNFPLGDFADAEILGFSGAVPVFTVTDSVSRTWYYSDAFTTATTGTIRLRVQHRCGYEGPFRATVHYDNICADDEAYEDACSASDSATYRRLDCHPILYKYPEIIYASGDVVTWTMTVINSAPGVAYGVVLTDGLGSDLRYLRSTITSTAGSAAGVIPITSTNVVTWDDLIVLPGEKYTLKLAAEIIGCDDLTNVFHSRRGCGGEVCETGCSLASAVKIPHSALINTNFVQPIATCFSGTVTATVRNAGLLSVYTATVTETLPPGVLYVPGTSEYVIGTGSTPPGAGWASTGDPTGAPAGPLVWTPSEIPALARLYPKQTVWVRFQVYADCDFDSGSIAIRTGYLDVCRNPRTTSPSGYFASVTQLDVTALKRGRNLSTGSGWGAQVYAEPGEQVQWWITMSNSSTTPAQLTVVTDVLPSNVTVSGISPSPDYWAGRVIAWDVGSLTGSWESLITATVNNGGCTELDERNVFTATWGCPDTTCRQATREEVTLRTRPVYDQPFIQTHIMPHVLHRCGDVLTITLRNNGPPAYNVALTDTLPLGFVYSDTLAASTPPSGTVDLGQTVVFTWSVLPTGVTALALRVNSGTSGDCTVPTGGDNVITLLYDDAYSCAATGPYTATASTHVDVNDPNLSVSKLPRTQSVGVGNTAAWTITLGNSGTAVAENVVVEDLLGDGFGTAGVVEGDGTVVGSGPITITWTGITLDPGDTWVRHVTATLSGSEVGHANQVTVTGECDAGCTYTTIGDTAYAAAFEFDKLPDLQTVTIGELISFTVDAYYYKPVSYTNAAIFDILPVGLRYVTSTLSQNGGPFVPMSPTLVSGNVLTWSLGSGVGPVAASLVLTAVVENVSSNQDGVMLTNEAHFSWEEFQSGGYVPHDESDDADVEIVEPVLHIGKSYVTPYGCRATLFQDNFNDGSAAPEWAEVNSGWSVANGVYQNTSTGNNRRTFAGQLGWTDYSFSTMIRSTDSDNNDYIGLIFRAQDNNNYYLFQWRRAGSGWRQRLQRVGAGGGTLDQNTDPGAAYEVGRWYHVEIRAEGSLLRVFVDGQEVLSALDTTYRSGRVGLHSHQNAVTSFDDVLVTRLDEAACTVGANDPVTYTLVVSNQNRLAGYDLVITDALPAGMSLVTYTVESDDPASAVEVEPASIPGATGVLTWGVNQLTSTLPFDPLNHTALTLTVVLRVADAITANVTLDNQAFLSYDNWEGDGDPVGDLYDIDIERTSSGGSHSTAVRTVSGGIAKMVGFRPPPTPTLGTLVTYTLVVPQQPITATHYDVVVTDTVDGRLFIEDVDTAGGTGAASGFVRGTGLVTATFDSIPHDTQAYVTVTTRISHEWPTAAGDANAGDVITDVAHMVHATDPVTDSNEVSTDVGEPDVAVAKSAESSTASLTDLDGTALLTYTIRLINTGSSPAYSVYVADAVPAGISVTAQYGGDAHGGPVVGPDVMTWTVDVISNVTPANVAFLTYTARITQARVDTWLTNTVDVVYHSLTDTIPGVRPYTDTDAVAVETGPITVAKSTDPITLRVGDIVSYHLAFTVPAGTVGMGGNSYLRDVLPPGVWYIIGSETLDWVPPSVNVVTTGRASGTLAGSQVITWTFGQPITSPLDLPTVVTLTFQAQAVGLRIDNGAPVWPDQMAAHAITDTVGLWERGEFVDDDEADNRVIQPRLTIDKDSIPPSGSYVSASYLITYTLTITNDGRGPAYDALVSDTLPVGLSYITSTIVGADPPTVAFTDEPSVGATDTITWAINELWGTDWNGGQPGVAVITMVARISDTLGAGVRLTNTAAIPAYDSQPGDGPGPWDPDEREYEDGEDDVWHLTPPPYLIKEARPITATVGDVIVFTIIGPYLDFAQYNVIVTDVIDSRLTVLDTQAIGVGDPPIHSSFTANVVTGTWGSVPARSSSALIITTTLSDPTAALAGDLITNTATFRWAVTPTGPLQPITSVNVVTVTVVEPVLSLVKASDPPTSSTVGVGDQVTYTVRITNGSAVTVSPAYDVVFTDTLPVGMRDIAPAILSVRLDGAPVSGGDYVSSYNAATGVLTVIFTPAFTIPVGSELDFRYIATVDSSVSAGVDLINRAETSWSSLPGSEPGDRDYGPIADSTNVHAGDPVIELTKSGAFAAIEAGGLLTYTLVATNTGVVSATGVVITDVVPANTAFVTATGASTVLCPPVGGTGLVTWVLGALDIGVPRSVHMVVLVDSGLPAGTIITNAGWLTSTEGLTDTDTITTPVGVAADVAVSKTDTPDPVAVGTLLTYTLEVVNNGPSDAQDVRVADTLPAEVTFITATVPVTVALPDLTWHLGTLVAGEVRHLTVTAQVKPDVTQPFTNTAVVTTTTPGDDPSNDEHDEPTTPLTPGLQLVKSVSPGQVVRGMPFTYTLRIINTGQITFAALRLTDTLPSADFHYVAGSGAPVDPDVIAEPLLVWSDLVPVAGSLSPGASLDVTFQVTPSVATGVYTNGADVTGDHPGGVITDTDDAPVTVVTPTIALDKRLVVFDNDEIYPNYVTFTIAITNLGPSTIDVLPLHDQYDPYYLGPVDASPTPDVYERGEGLMTWSDLTGSAPHGFGRDLPVGEAFHVTTVFSVVHTIDVTTTNVVTTTGGEDVYRNEVNDDSDAELIMDFIPTAVELLHLGVGAVGGRGVQLEWATAVEIDNFGFNVYRAPVDDRSQATLLTLVPSRARAGGATYLYEDTVPTDGVWWYWVADVDTSGLETFHGPVSARVGVSGLTEQVYLPLVMRRHHGDVGRGMGR